LKEYCKRKNRKKERGGGKEMSELGMKTGGGGSEKNREKANLKGQRTGGGGGGVPSFWGGGQVTCDEINVTGKSGSSKSDQGTIGVEGTGEGKRGGGFTLKTWPWGGGVGAGPCFVQGGNKKKKRV